ITPPPIGPRVRRARRGNHGQRRGSSAALELRLLSPLVMTASPLIASVSVDLDAVACYFRIHGLPGAPPEMARHAVLRRCLPRFAELFAEAGVKATFFVVGRDLVDDAEGRARLAALAALGHELANHTFTHPYDLVRQ